MTTDRELAREWVGDVAFEDEHRDMTQAFLAGLERGRAGLTWTGEPPAAETFDPERPWWWFRFGPDERILPVEVMRFGGTGGLTVDLPTFRGPIAVADCATHYPACQWSSAPIPHPAPREPTT